MIHLVRYKVPQAVKKEAKKGLKLRKELKTGNADNRRGYVTARALTEQDSVTASTVNKMRAFFARWEKTKNASEIQKVNWLLWGGDAGKRWVDRL